MRVYRFYGAAAVLAASVSMAALARAETADSATVADASANGDAITVTAQKREQRVQDVPVTVSAMTAERMRQLGVSELGEMAAYVPGLQIQKQSANNPGFVIRGITSDNGSAQQGSRVTLYYNGIDTSRARGAWQDLFDMERVEVVKGPQATLFGTAAEVGAVSLISARPVAGTSGAINASYGNYQRTQVSGFLNVGNDTLAGRVAFSHKYRHGYTQNIQPGGQDLNGEDDWGARASLRWTPSPSLTVDAILTYDRQRDPGTGFTSLVYPTTTGSTNPFGQTQLSGSPYSAQILGDSQLGLKRDMYDGNITARIQIAPGVTFTTVNGYRQFNAHEVFDADGSRAFYLEFAEAAVGQQFSHEGRFNFDSQKWHATFGWNAFVENSYQSVPFSTEEGTYLSCATIASFAPFQAALAPYGVGTGRNCVNGNGVAAASAAYGHLPASYFLTNGAATSVPYSASYTNKGVNKTYSLFADATFVATPRLELTAGVRLLIESRKSEYASYQPNSQILARYGVSASLLGLANTNGQVFAATRSYAAALPRFNALYRLNRDLNLYATISEGRRSPVVQLSAATVNGVVVPALQNVAAETLWNYEAGIKGRIGKFTGALSGFYQVYNGFQVTVTQNGTSVTQSAGSAHNPGVEAEGTYAFSPIVSLTGSFAYLNGRIDSNAANGTYAGNHFRLQPDFSGSLALNVRVPVRDDLLVYFAPNWNYRSKVYFEMPNLEAISQQAYSLYNLRAGVEVGRKHQYTVGGFVRNLTNRHYLLDAGNTGGSFGDPTYIAGEPRTFGVEASARF